MLVLENIEWFLPQRKLKVEGIPNAGERVLCAGNPRMSQFLQKKGYSVVESRNAEKMLGALSSDRGIGIIVSETNIEIGNLYGLRIGNPKHVGWKVIREHIYENGYHSPPPTVIYTKYMSELREMINGINFDPLILEYLSNYITIMEDKVSTSADDRNLLKEMDRHSITRNR